jgi:hypothetical protein
MWGRRSARGNTQECYRMCQHRRIVSRILQKFGATFQIARYTVERLRFFDPHDIFEVVQGRSAGFSHLPLLSQERKRILL